MVREDYKQENGSYDRKQDRVNNFFIALLFLLALHIHHAHLVQLVVRNLALKVYVIPEDFELLDKCADEEIEPEHV